MIASWRDPLMLDPGLPVTYASFGGQRRRAVDGRVTSAMNDRPRASVVLDVNSEQPVDYLAELKIITKTAGSERVLFTGFADSGEVDGNTVVIEAQGATELAERSTGRLAIKSAPAVDVIYLMARDAGYSDDRLQIQGLDDLPLELFQVMVPVAGIELGASLDLGGVILLPAGTLGPHATALQQVFANLELDSFGCVAVAYVTANQMYAAEARGGARVRVALDGLMAVALYGLSVRPDGTAIPYSRQVARARPHALPAICVKGLATDRTWIRGTEASHITTAGDADLLSRRLFDLQRVTPPQHVRDALASLRRAADRNESAVQRGQALWDAVEFLCAGTRVEKQFSKMEKRAIRDAVKDVQLTSDQQRRLDDALQYLNAPSLAMRMRARASADGVPLSKPEIDLLHRTRASRNDAVHGRAGATPTDPELRWAVSIVARMIMYRWHAEVVQRLP